MAKKTSDPQISGYGEIQESAESIGFPTDPNVRNPFLDLYAQPVSVNPVIQPSQSVPKDQAQPGETAPATP